MKELKTGDWCYAGNKEDKEKRIYLGTFGAVNICVARSDENKYTNGEYFDVGRWREVHHIEDEQEPKIFYQWEKIGNGRIFMSDPMTYEYAKGNGYVEDGWTKIESSMRVV